MFLTWPCLISIIFNNKTKLIVANDMYIIIMWWRWYGSGGGDGGSTFHWWFAHIISLSAQPSAPFQFQFQLHSFRFGQQHHFNIPFRLDLEILFIWIHFENIIHNFKYMDERTWALFLGFRIYWSISLSFVEHPCQDVISRPVCGAGDSKWHFGETDCVKFGINYLIWLEWRAAQLQWPDTRN